jgi:hypothetical protein
MKLLLAMRNQIACEEASVNKTLKVKVILSKATSKSNTSHFRFSNTYQRLSSKLWNEQKSHKEKLSANVEEEKANVWN